jgi:hypothetical protein
MYDILTELLDVTDREDPFLSTLPISAFDCVERIVSMVDTFIVLMARPCNPDVRPPSPNCDVEGPVSSTTILNSPLFE